MPAQAGLGHGTTVQLTCPPMITATPSRTDGSRSRPARAGSMSSNSPGAVGPASAIVAPAIRPISTMRWPSHGGTQSRRLGGGVGQAGQLDLGVEPGDVHVAGAPGVGGRCDGAHQLLLPRAPADGDDLVRLDVGPHLDGETGEAVDAGVAHTRRLVNGPVS